MFDSIISRRLTLGLLLATGVLHAEQEIVFAVNRYQIEGNHLLLPAAIDEALRPFVGSQKSFADVQHALETLEKQYQAAGYGAVMVSIPEQELQGGVIRLQVIEPKLNQISVLYADPASEAHFSKANVLAALPALQTGKTPSTTTIAENVQLSNENPAKQVETLLSVEDDPQKVDVKVKVNAQPARKAFLSFDNTGTSQNGEYRLGFGLQHANLFDRDHVFTLNYITPPERAGEVNLYSLSYRLPVYDLGDSIDFIAARSEMGVSSTPTVAGTLQFAGNGDVLGLHYNHLFPRWGEYTHRLTLGLDYQAFKNQCSHASLGAAACGTANTDISLLPVSLSYQGQWLHPGQSLEFFATALHNIPGLPQGNTDNFWDVRPALVKGKQRGGAEKDYYALRFGAGFTQAFMGDWQLHVVGNAQYTSDALVYVEQLGLAGSTTVRGFWEREVTRDMGYVLNTEVYTPNFAHALGDYAESVRVLAFFDYGSGRNNPLRGETNQAIALTSVGLGLRVGFPRSLQVRLEGAYVFDGVEIKNSTNNHSDGDMRGHVSLYLPYAF